MPRVLSTHRVKRHRACRRRNVSFTRPVFVVSQTGQRAYVRAVGVVAQVSVTPSATDMPGGALIGKLLAWLAQLCLYGGVAAMFIGGLSAALSHRSGYSAGGSRGREIILGGVAAAILGGLGPTIVNVLYAAAR